MNSETNRQLNLTIGLMAHVDAGKTTLSEAILYSCGAIRNFGRVDHKDAFLDTYHLEKDRGITIFSKQAIFELGKTRVFLLDTPGHIDFSAEMERTLSVLDYAVLIISGPDGIQAHTQTLWNLLRRYRVPAFVWVNKMDMCQRTRGDIIRELIKEFGDGFCDFSDFCGNSDAALSDIYEKIAALDESAMEEYFAGDGLGDDTVRRLIKTRRLFPCFFGSALKQEGVTEFLNVLQRFAEAPDYPAEFASRVFKITRDERGERLTWMKILGGSLRVREQINEEKISQIRFYSGAKFSPAEEAPAGSVCAVTGLDKTYAGQGLGKEEDAKAPVLEPVLTYGIRLPEGTDAHSAYSRLCQLAEEDPMLRIVWDSHLREIQAQLMGEVQIDILKQIIKERFDIDAQIDAGKIMYKETIAAPVEGAGHFEPLRHYAEVHLLMEPLPTGTGIILESACSTDVLDLNWQRLILTNLAEKEHLGVLTGSPLTDVKVTLIAGRAHLKHTEGGDFRQATYRAVRQGLMKAQNVLLEPYYDFVLTVPHDQIGRAVSDLKSMSASFDAPQDSGNGFRVTGRGPVSEMSHYQTELQSYTKGRGRISCSFAGYFPCHNTAKVVEETGYEADRDVENTADSVFCSHGAGVNVKWDKADGFMHVDSGLSFSGGTVSEAAAPKVRSRSTDFDEKELEAIMLREFGPIRRPQYSAVTYDYNKDRGKAAEIKKEYYIVDGYNVIFAWDELKRLAKDSIDSARDRLISALSSFAGYKGCELVLVFDGYKVKGNPGTREEDQGIRVAYTRENETADQYIEKLVHEIGKNYSVKVATSDGLIQLAALRLGVIRMSSRELKSEVDRTLAEIREILDRQGYYRNTLGDVIKDI